jgi:hypothetical protein
MDFCFDPSWEDATPRAEEETASPTGEEETEWPSDEDTSSPTLSPTDEETTWPSDRDTSAPTLSPTEKESTETAPRTEWGELPPNDLATQNLIKIYVLTGGDCSMN